MKLWRSRRLVMECQLHQARVQVERANGLQLRLVVVGGLQRQSAQRREPSGTNSTHRLGWLPTIAALAGEQFLS